MNIAQCLIPGQPLFRPDGATAPFDFSRLPCCNLDTSDQPAAMGGDARAVLDYIESHPDAMFGAIRAACCLKITKAKRIMRGLVAHGYLMHSGAVRRYHYRVVEPATKDVSVGGD